MFGRIEITATKYVVPAGKKDTDDAIGGQWFEKEHAVGRQGAAGICVFCRGKKSGKEKPPPEKKASPINQQPSKQKIKALEH